MDITNQKLKELVVNLDLIPEARIDSALKFAEESKKGLAEVLVESDLISDDHLGQIIADEFNYPYIDLGNVSIDKEVLNLIPKVMAQKQKVIVFEQGEKGIKIAMVNPGNISVINLLRKKTGEKIIPYYTTSKNVRVALSKYQKGIEKEFAEIIQENISEVKKGSKEKELPIIKIVDTLIEYAYENNASDIHIEPGDNATLVRFRIDGILHDIIELPKNIHDLIVTRIKILSKLRTDEHRSAQDGKIRVKFEVDKLDIRVSIVPIVEGEKIVMRLLSERSRQFSLEELGFVGEDLIKLKKEYSKPYGMILATGPTGSGKTTTLYGILKILNRREVNISTIEDPVEYDVAGVNQIQVSQKSNLTFAKGLRSLLRQDPDIVMVGEIRDEETADIAVNAAMTGHLVLSTLHTNDAPTTLPRLLKMKIEPFLISSTVNIIIAQRLVRKICKQCIVSTQYNQEDLVKKFNTKLIDEHLSGDKKSIRLYHGKGCKLCNGTGYSGRIGIFEVLVVTEPIRDLIMKRTDADQIRKQARLEGMRTMKEDGIQKALAGTTTLEEVMRATRE